MMNPSDECAIQPKRSRFDPVLGPLAFLVAVGDDLRPLVREARRRGQAVYQNQWLRVFRFGSGPEAVAFSGPVLGAPQAVMLLEKLIALGARRVLFVGWAGSLDPALKPGDLLLPVRAVSEEGTSRHYAPEPDPRAPEGWIREIAGALERSGWPCRTGAVWTTDAPYRETWAKITAYRAAGVAAVDMETAALFTVGLFRKIEVAALLIISDELSGTRWQHAFRDPRFLQSRQRLREWLLLQAIHREKESPAFPSSLGTSLA
ncbi:MAG: nucleoside phosphorylase [Deltaproteobacteria bacterium]|nr:nucleoside phosphorylase [Deltaproteobacteria bacterium]